MTTSTLTDARRDSLTAYLSLFASDCAWHDFATTTVVHTGSIGAIAANLGCEDADYRSALDVLTAACGVTHLWEVAHDSVNGTEVFMFGTSKPRQR